MQPDAWVVAFHGGPLDGQFWHWKGKPARALHIACHPAPWMAPVLIVYLRNGTDDAIQPTPYYFHEDSLPPLSPRPAGF
jgi:hypothetical protein